jgi:hypothetical protein
VLGETRTYGFERIIRAIRLVLELGADQREELPCGRQVEDAIPRHVGLIVEVAQDAIDLRADASLAEHAPHVLPRRASRRACRGGAAAGRSA